MAKKAKTSPSKGTVTKKTGKGRLSFFKTKNGRYSLIAVLAIAGGLITTGVFVGIDLNKKPIIDGRITGSDWKNMKYKSIPFWLDVSNVENSDGTRDVDAWNYLYLGWDASWYYVGVDMCSDRSPDTTGEWLQLLLSEHMPEVSNSYSGLHGLVDYGMEILTYNVTNGTAMTDGIDSSVTTSAQSDIPIVPVADTIDLHWGSLVGENDISYQELWANDSIEYTIDSYLGTQSEFDPTGVTTGNSNFLRWDISVNMSSKFPRGFEAQFLSAMTTIDVNVILTSNLGSDGSPAADGNVSNIYVAMVSDSNPDDIQAITDWSGLFGTNDGEEFDFSPNTPTLNTLSTTAITSVNATTNMMHLSLFVWNELGGTPFDIQIDKISLEIDTEQYGTYNYTSIPDDDDYAVSHGFGPSPNSAEDHRMYEFKIAKTEFTSFINNELYVRILGAGGVDLDLGSTAYWFYPASLNEFVSLIAGTNFPLLSGQFAYFN